MFSQLKNTSTKFSSLSSHPSILNLKPNNKLNAKLHPQLNLSLGLIGCYSSSRTSSLEKLIENITPPKKAESSQPISKQSPLNWNSQPYNNQSIGNRPPSNGQDFRNVYSPPGFHFQNNPNNQGGYNKNNTTPSNVSNNQGGYNNKGGYTRNNPLSLSNSYNNQGSYNRNNSSPSPNEYSNQGVYSRSDSRPTVNGYNNQGGYSRNNSFPSPNRYNSQGSYNRNGFSPSPNGYSNQDRYSRSDDLPYANNKANTNQFRNGLSPSKVQPFNKNASIFGTPNSSDSKQSFLNSRSDRNAPIKRDIKPGENTADLKTESLDSPSNFNLDKHKRRSFANPEKKIYSKKLLVDPTKFINKAKKLKPINIEQQLTDDLNSMDEDLDEEAIQKRRMKLVRQRQSKLSANSYTPGKRIAIPFATTVDSLAKIMGVKMATLLSTMETMNFDKLAPNYMLTNDEASEIAKRFRLVPVPSDDPIDDIFPREISSDIKSCPIRPPVVTIMGHVDHGKTTLLDSLRKSRIVDQEAGGITQHIGAFSVKIDDNQLITFLDTPGHAAFAAMRKRGANVTDIAVIVVAADDGVMPQTKEAIKYALEANAPIIIAITKCDKHDADPEKIKNQLLENEIQVEDLGGDIQAVEISAKNNEGLDLLKENILVLSEILELNAETNIPAEGRIIETKIVKGRGNEASVIITRGTLEQGDILVAGKTWCKVRTMSDENSKKLLKVTPGIPALITGWKTLPSSGDLVLCCESESKAKQVVAYREKVAKRLAAVEEIQAFNANRLDLNKKKVEEKQLKAAEGKASYNNNKNQKSRRENITVETQTSEPKTKKLSIIAKADTFGTLEAVIDSLVKLPQKKISIDILNSSVGNVTDSDIQIASTEPDSTIVCFNVKPDKQIANLAKRSKVNIMSHSIIYKLLDETTDLMKKLLDPVFEDEVAGEARVQEVFSISVKNKISHNIAGSRVMSGKIEKNSMVKIIRDGKIIYTSTVDTLRQVKREVSEIGKGQDCGIGITDFEDIQSDDIIQAYVKKEVEQTL